MFEFLGCTIAVEPEHMNAVVITESSGNPYAVGVVGHKLSRQPRSHAEALAIVTKLIEGGYNYSVGIAQVNKTNFKSQKLDDSNMFDLCSNLKAGSYILKACYEQYADWAKAYSCYYSGNAITGFRHGYVQKVQNNLQKNMLTGARYPPPATENLLPISIFPRGSVAAPPKTIPERPTLISRRLSSGLTDFTQKTRNKNAKSL